MLKAILFDLDGTLLPMDQEAFTSGYFKMLAKKVAYLGYTPRELVAAIWAGTEAMVKNDGQDTNETVFWRKFTSIYGEAALEHKPVFDAFYRVEFQQAKQFCGFQPMAAQTVRQAGKLGFRVALATNPIFPAIATESRIRWAGLEPEDFALYTTYETARYSKPNPLYFKEVAAALEVEPEACLMVGNDATEDLPAKEIGMEVFLLTDCLINSENRDISQVPHGDYAALMAYIQECCAL